MDEFLEAIKLRKLYKSLGKVCAGSMWKDGTSAYRWDGLKNSVKMRQSCLDGTYKLQRYLVFNVTRPKPRKITATRVRDRHLQRSLCDNVLYDVITRPFIYNNGACQRGKGVDFALQRVAIGMQRIYEEQRQQRAKAMGCRVEDVGPFIVEGAIYKGDISKYFPSSRHSNAKRIIRRCITSPRACAVLCAVIESFGEDWWCEQAQAAGASKEAARRFARDITDARTEREMLPLRPANRRKAIAQQCEAKIDRAINGLKGITPEARQQLREKARADEVRGIALGSQVSQLVQLAQLNGIDHYATEVAHVSEYDRYMDDYTLMDSDRSKVERAAADITGMLNDLGLTVNPKSQIVPLKDGIIFLKWRIKLTPTGGIKMMPAHGVIKDEKRRLRRMVKKYEEGKATEESIRAHYAGKRAHLERGDTEQMLKNLDKYLDRLLEGAKKKKGMIPP